MKIKKSKKSCEKVRYSRRIRWITLAAIEILLLTYFLCVMLGLGHSIRIGSAAAA